jgi:hypothetical protein
LPRSKKEFFHFSQALSDLEHYVAELALLPTAYPLPGHGNAEMDVLKVELRRLDPGAGLPTPTPEPGA